jgi:hypothetical protein
LVCDAGDKTETRSPDFNNGGIAIGKLVDSKYLRFFIHTQGLNFVLLQKKYC